MNHLGLLAAAYLAFAVHLALAADMFAPGSTKWTIWSEFKRNHSKSYESEQVEEMRQAIFARNLFEIRRFNEQADEAQSFKLGLNHLADMSSSDMEDYFGFRPQAFRDQFQNTPEAQHFLYSILADNTTEVPDNVDWSYLEYSVTKVKNQGLCASSWAFSAVGALEGQEMKRGVPMKEGRAVELSPQNLVDCVKVNQGVRGGCDGGTMWDAFDQIAREGGIDSEASYPYVASPLKCRFNKSHSVLANRGHVFLPEADEEMLKQVVAKHGPVSVAMDASSRLFQFYRGGVLKIGECGQKLKDLNHAVLVVGYGTDFKEGDYWIVKNSWGPEWGERGYFRISRNEHNMCGIATVAVLPTF